VKAREVGERLGLSASEAAAALRELLDAGEVEKWGRSRAISWRITDDLDAPELATDGGQPLEAVEAVAEDLETTVADRPRGYRTLRADRTGVGRAEGGRRR